MGQSHILVDYPAPSGALSLAEERSQNRRPYWIEVDPTNLYGWRLDRESNYGNPYTSSNCRKGCIA